MKRLLTIAGSDCSGGAGIQADLKTFSALGTYGMSVITAITAQNTQGVDAVVDIDKTMVKAQIDAIFEDIVVDAVKVGMVSSSEIILQITNSLLEWLPPFLVVDPVMVSTSGRRLLKPEAKNTLIKELFPITTLVTPNIPEAETILDTKIVGIEDMERAAKAIYALGPKGVLVKGGHLLGDAVDIFYDGTTITKFTSPRIYKKNTHGTGCTLSSAIATHLALGFDLVTAISKSKDYVTKAIDCGIAIGKGVGPLHHFHQFYPSTVSD
ncbi:bifunctional hydroxymethylpyrimidine kinase/phosphomethylpyrimidine kinase [Clostridium formicaceticum]|uniref:Hydroxymethylpyrimidine/phosphomethylpyrimidine kinase n=1 Tax=Clostridium formicaceticum TaxID=1497 RepID=A0AAC9RLT6_9CLOT|nr:bifunctional hydroxymethylpyrimidine kinase/phosphomethylpyrimidine kinase [Clostridium formicaceticum]AOY77455.1 bifunctional hydroxymethylpyrimidine kinase/phosphomethylpyrimidine kinase [Clostridium formicaceticum]ARE88012.1 Hydroxymethylpyrimidine/phosphomethylpyrimidine kinase [Clostridium formicaceticum]